MPAGRLSRRLAAVSRLGAGLFFAVVAVGLTTSVEIETRDLDCGGAPTAAISHHEPDCKTEARNQLFGATVAGAFAVVLLFGPTLAHHWWLRVPPAALVKRDEPFAFDELADKELRSYRRRAWLWTACGSVLLTGFTVAASVVADRSEELERAGARVPGTVVATHGQGERGSVEVTFSWNDELRRERVHLDAESRRYQVGERVTVLVDRDDPDHFSLSGETNQSPVTVWPMILLFVGASLALCIGIGALVRSARQRTILQAFSWRSLAASYVEIPGYRGSVRALLLLKPAQLPEGVILTLAETARWRLSQTGLRQADTVQVAGPLPGYVVVRALGRVALVSARPPFSRRTERKWREAMAEHEG
jgi:hypothetical protein